MRQRSTFLISSLTAALTLTIPEYLATASSRDTEQENERIIHRGSTACGVERWFVKMGMDGDASKVNTKAVVQTTIFHLRSLTPPSVLPSRSRVR